MFWPLSAFFRQKISLFYRFTFGRGCALTFRSGEGALGQVRLRSGALALGCACARVRLRSGRCACARVSKAHKKTAHLGRLVYMLFTNLAICSTSSDVARRRSLRDMPRSLAFTVTPLPDLPRGTLKTLWPGAGAGASPKPSGLVV